VPWQGAFSCSVRKSVLGGELLDLQDGALPRTSDPPRRPVDSVEVTLSPAAQAFSAGEAAHLNPGLMLELPGGYSAKGPRSGRRG
jgi:hypothetical protein